MVEAAGGMFEGAFVSCGQLKELMANEDISLKLFDSSFAHCGPDVATSKENFKKEAIVGAKCIPMEMIHVEGAKFPFTFPSKPHFIATMKALSIRKSDIVVLYGQPPMVAIVGASRVWFMLNKFGHKNAYILDGNLSQWKEEGGKTEAGGEPGPSEPGDYDYDIDFSFNLNLEQISHFVEEGDTNKILLDARPLPAFEKPPKEGRSLGKMPNAIHVNPAKLMKPNNVHKSPEEIKEYLTGLGNNHSQNNTN